MLLIVKIVLASSSYLLPILQWLVLAGLVTDTSSCRSGSSVPDCISPHFVLLHATMSWWSPNTACGDLVRQEKSLANETWLPDFLLMVNMWCNLRGMTTSMSL